MTKSELSAAILAAYNEAGRALGTDVTDEMAVPAYLAGRWISRYVFWRKLDFIVSNARLRPGTRVFDFGCGTGILLPRLCADGRQVTATDLHPEIARCLVRNLGLANVEFVAADSWEQRLADGQVETIIAANVLEHIEDRREVLATLRRKLSPSGRLVISGPTENRLYRFGRRLIGFSGSYHVTSIDTILADARAVGLRPERLTRFPLPGPLCLYKIAAFTAG
jgi:ubiquinone/menaquinone biosynthesis C-methylase UbiE